MSCHGRLMLLGAVLMGVLTSGVCIAEDRRILLIHQNTQVEVRPTERTIASKPTRDLVITITNPEGKLRGGNNDVCVVFETRETREPVDVQNVGIDFSLLVGRIQEEPIKAELAPDRTGRYCGHVNLGKQYYVPASYYAFVLYTEAGHKKRKERFFLSVK